MLLSCMDCAAAWWIVLLRGLWCCMVCVAAWFVLLRELWCCMVCAARQILVLSDLMKEDEMDGSCGT